MARALRTIDPTSLKALLDRGKVLLVDIREPSEFAREHIPGARLVPMSAFDRHEFDGDDHGRTVVFHCRSGNRTAVNAGRLQARGFRDALVLRGGLDAWKAAGLPVNSDRAATAGLLRLVRVAAGLLALAGLVLAVAAAA